MSYPAVEEHLTITVGNDMGHIFRAEADDMLDAVRWTEGRRTQGHFITRCPIPNSKGLEGIKKDILKVMQKQSITFVIRNS